MPVKIPSSLPAVEILKAENIFVMDDLRASTQDIRPLKLLILNLMPLKIVTETDLLRLISNTPLQIELDFMSYKQETAEGKAMREWIVDNVKPLDVTKIRAKALTFKL